LLATTETDPAFARDAARPSSRPQPRLAETRDEVAPRLELRAGERLAVSSRLAADDRAGDTGMLRTVAIVAIVVLAVIGIVAVLHTLGLRIPF
jgi:hypothetical protein